MMVKDYPSERSSVEEEGWTQAADGLPQTPAGQFGWTRLGSISFVPGLEGLRGFAVILVMISHVIPGKEMLGTLGVGVFFVLSGFLITGVLQGKIEKQERNVEDVLPRVSEKQQQQQQQKTMMSNDKLTARFAYLPGFYMDRFVRLTPAVLCMVGLMTYMCLKRGISREQIVPDAFAALFYTHNNYPIFEQDARLMRPGMFLNTWSLAVEEQFYIFWSIAISFLLARRLRTQIFLLLGLIGSSFYVRYYAGYAFLQPNMYGIDYRYAWSANVWKMFLGCAVRIAPIPRFWQYKHTGFFSTVLLGILTYAWGWGLVHRGYDYRTEGAFLELFTSLLVAQTIVGSISGNSILESKILRFVGRVSYSLYLWQFPLQAFWGWPVYDWGPTGVAFAVSIFSTFIIEEPVRKIYQKLKGPSH